MTALALPLFLYVCNCDCCNPAKHEHLQLTNCTFNWLLTIAKGDPGFLMESFLNGLLSISPSEYYQPYAISQSTQLLHTNECCCCFFGVTVIAENLQNSKQEFLQSTNCLFIWLLTYGDTRFELPQTLQVAFAKSV